MCFPATVPNPLVGTSQFLVHCSFHEVYTLIIQMLAASITMSYNIQKFCASGNLYERAKIHMNFMWHKSSAVFYLDGKSIPDF